jgi:hypothetical protein
LTPAPSPELDPEATPQRRFGVWRAASLNYAVSEVVGFLPAVRPVANQILLGGSLVFWSEAARFALEMKRRNQTLSAPEAEEAVSCFERAMPAAARALAVPRGAVRLMPERVFRNFAEQIIGPPSSPESGTPSLCFRLEPPAETAGNWKLLFFQQMPEDKSLFLPAAKIWNSSQEENFLGSLGRAARIWPPLATGLSQARPESLSLSAGAAYEFLREGAARLRGNGYLAYLPAWWAKPESRPAVRLIMKEPPGDAPSLGLNALADFDWEIALGGQKISLQEFRAAVEAKLPLVKVRGRWIELTAEVRTKALDFLSSGKERLKMKFGGVLRQFLSGEPVELGLPIGDLEGEKDWGGVLAGLTGKPASAAAPVSGTEMPDAFRGTLRPYQLRGVTWLRFLRKCGLGACLADDMGLGKTIQLLAFLLCERTERACGPALLVCPMSVVSNWQREIEKFAPSLRTVIHHGEERAKGEGIEAAAKTADLVITTYALALRDEEHLGRVAWEQVVLDEAQNIKNPEALQTRAVKRFRAGQKIVLTGTPVENRVSDLWSLMDFLNPGFLGGVSEFTRQSRNTIRRLTRPFLLRRLKTDPAIVPDLPEKMEMKVYCDLTREQAVLYEAAVADLLERAGQASGIQRKGIVLAALTKFKQICNHPAQYLRDGSALEGRSGKLARLAEMLEEAVSEGDKSLVFTQFREMGDLLQSYLSALFPEGVFFLHGEMPMKDRGEMIFRFQNEPGTPSVFILSLRAGGTGLNLTRANRVFHFDRWWNPAVEDQATDRAFRIGQTKNVQVHKLIAAGTVEEKIDHLLEDKRGLAGLVSGGEGWITEMPEDELRELFALRREKTGD